MFINKIVLLFLIISLVGCVSAESITFTPKVNVVVSDEAQYLWLNITDIHGVLKQIGFRKTQPGMIAFGKNSHYYGSMNAVAIYNDGVDDYLCEIRNIDNEAYTYGANYIEIIITSPDVLQCKKWSKLSAGKSYEFTEVRVRITCDDYANCKIESDVTSTAEDTADTGFGFFSYPDFIQDWRYVEIDNISYDTQSVQTLPIDHQMMYQNDDHMSIKNLWDWADMVCPSCIEHAEVIRLNNINGVLTAVTGMGASQSISIDPLFIFVGDGNITFDGEPDTYHGYRVGEINLTVHNNLDVDLNITYEDIYLNFPFNFKQKIWYMKTDLLNVTENGTVYYYNFTSLQWFNENITVEPSGKVNFTIIYTIPESEAGADIKFDLIFKDVVMDPYFVSDHTNLSNGVFTNTTLDPSSARVRINESLSNFSGYYETEIYDAGESVDWTNLSWSEYIHQGCYGTVTPCSQVDSLSCNKQLGCTWSGFPDLQCLGTATACSAIGNYPDCSPRNDSSQSGTSQFGCYWGNQTMVANVRSCDDGACSGETYGADDYTNGSIVKTVSIIDNQYAQVRYEFWTWNITEGGPELISSSLGYEVSVIPMPDIGYCGISDNTTVLGTNVDIYLNLSNDTTAVDSVWFGNSTNNYTSSVNTSVQWNYTYNAGVVGDMDWTCYFNLTNGTVYSRIGDDNPLEIQDICRIETVSIVSDCSGSCGAGETINMTATLNGVAQCQLVDAFQIDAWNTDGSCNITFTGGDMSGITDDSVTLPSPYTSINGTWTIPSVHADCIGETIYANYSALWEGTVGSGTKLTQDPSPDATGSFTFETAQGDPCSADDECISGFCTDGVCCNIDCAGECQVCNDLDSGTNGTCHNVSIGADPQSECAIGFECGTGFCNGAAACGWVIDVEGQCGTCKTCNGSTSQYCVNMADNTQDVQGFNLCDATCRTCNGVGSCVDQDAGEDLFAQCANQDCTEYIFGWGVINSALSCRVESATTEGYCVGSSAACRSEFQECTVQDIENGQSGSAVCGSSGCKNTCPNDGAAVLYDTVSEVCFITGQQGCSAGYECDSTGTCVYIYHVPVDDYCGIEPNVTDMHDNIQLYVNFTSNVVDIDTVWFDNTTNNYTSDWNTSVYWNRTYNATVSGDMNWTCRWNITNGSVYSRIGDDNPLSVATTTTIPTEPTVDYCGIEPNITTQNNTVEFYVNFTAINNIEDIWFNVISVNYSSDWNTTVYWNYTYNATVVGDHNMVCWWNITNGTEFFMASDDNPLAVQVSTSTTTTSTSTTSSSTTSSSTTSSSTTSSSTSTSTTSTIPIDVCLGDGDCASDYYCNENDLYCWADKPNNQTCNRDAMCISDNCIEDTLCGPVGYECLDIDLLGCPGNAYECVMNATNSSCAWLPTVFGSDYFDGIDTTDFNTLDGNEADATFTLHKGKIKVTFNNMDLTDPLNFTEACRFGQWWAWCNDTYDSRLVTEFAGAINFTDNPDWTIKLLTGLMPMRNGIRCPGSICTGMAKAGDTIWFNINTWSNYTIVNSSTYDATYSNLQCPDWTYMGTSKEPGWMTMYFELKNTRGDNLEDVTCDIYVTNHDGVLIKNYRTLLRENEILDNTSRWIPMSNSAGGYAVKIPIIDYPYFSYQNYTMWAVCLHQEINCTFEVRGFQPVNLDDEVEYYQGMMQDAAIGIPAFLGGIYLMFSLYRKVKYGF